MLLGLPTSCRVSVGEGGVWWERSDIGKSGSPTPGCHLYRTSEHESIEKQAKVKYSSCK